MENLRLWLSEQGLSVRELALQMEAPLKTVEDWAYRGVAPSPVNKKRLDDFVEHECTHHWVIESPNGPLSAGVCQRCGGEREFENSGQPTSPWLFRLGKAPKR